MYTFLLVLLMIDSLVLIAAILLQSGKGSGLAASFGGVSSSHWFGVEPQTGRDLLSRLVSGEISVPA